MLGPGFLRFIMIISIFNFNNNEEYHYSFFFSGVIALRLFFIFSGFFIDLSYHKYKDAKSFYISRIARIFPCYWFVAAAEYLFQRFRINYFYLQIKSKDLNPFIARFIQFSNVFLFGKDDIFFLSQDQKKQIHWITSKEKNTLTYYLMVFPSWSMGIMMKFYLLVPVLAKIRSLYLFILFITLFSLRAFFYSVLKMNFDPYNYRFFPFELSFFLVGQLMNRFYTKYQRLYDEIDRTSIPIVLISIFMLLYDHYFSFLGQQFLPLLMIFFLPYLFHISRNSIIDRKIGDLVYYMYIWQNFVALIMDNSFPRVIISGSKFLIIEILLCFILSIMFDEIVQKFINMKFKLYFVEYNICLNAVLNFQDMNKEFDIRESTQFDMVNGDKLQRNSASETDSV